MKSFLKSKLSVRTFQNLKAVYFDCKRLQTRIFQAKKISTPEFSKLHLGCGIRKVNGWLNVDVVNSDCNLDLAHAKLPWKENSFDFVVSQHFIEHLLLEDELFPLLKETYRVMNPGAEIWLTTPDMEKICTAYLEKKLDLLIADRKTRMKDWDLKGFPPQQMLNDFFQQEGEHKNLFDFDLLKFVLGKNNFREVKRVSEKDFLNRFPEFPSRNDEAHAMYVVAKK